MPKPAMFMLFAIVALASGQGETDLLAKYQSESKANPNGSLPHFRIAELYLQQRNYHAAANEFRAALTGDSEPSWIVVWSHINLGKIFDLTSQRDRAINEYHQAQRTKDNTRGALQEAERYLAAPYTMPEK